LLFKEFGNPLAFQAQCRYFCLVCHLRGSPFSDVNYTVNLQIFPLQIEQIQPQASATSPGIMMGFMFPFTAIVPGNNGWAKNKIEFQTVEGLHLKGRNTRKTNLRWKITKGKRMQLMQTATNSPPARRSNDSRNDSRTRLR